MAKKPVVPASPDDIDEGSMYDIRVTSPVTVGRRTLAVSLPHQVSGKVLKSIWESVRDVRKATG